MRESTREKKGGGGEREEGEREMGRRERERERERKGKERQYSSAGESTKFLCSQLPPLWTF